MSSVAVDIGPQHPAVMKHRELTPPRIICPTGVASSVSVKEESGMDDIIGSPQVQPSTSSGDKDSKKKSGAGFNLKQTAKNVVSGIKRKKKGQEEEERSKSHEELSADIGDQAAANTGKTKNYLAFNKMLSSFSNPSQKFNKMWSSLNKKPFTSTPSQDQYTNLSGTRSTMTLGRFFGKKRDTENDMPPLKEERKAQTLGRMFHFKTPSKNKPQNDSSGASIEKDTKDA